MLLQILAVWPAPTLPAWKMLAPMMSNSGRARSSAASLPPTMNVSVPAAAPAVPPETGASIKSTPLAWAAAPTFCALAAAMVLLSIINAPAGSMPSKPLSPRYSASTWALAGSMLTTTSAPWAASKALAATVTPSARTASQAAADKSKAATSWPAFFRLTAIGPPMLPIPINAIFMMISKWLGLTEAIQPLVAVE